MTIFNNISKRDMVLLSLLVVCLITVSLYQTLATDVTMNKTNVASVDMSYTFDITDQTGRVVKVGAGSTKVLDIFLTNNNNGTISYGIAYTPSSVKNDNITIAQMSGSKDSVSGTINKNEKKQISLVIVNNSSSAISLTLVPVTGYEHGGDLIVPSNHTLISDVTLPEPVNAADYITSLVSSNPDTMNNDDPGKNPRYMGADPNNYVSFNGELWRIIGVFDVKSSADGQTEKRVKIIRDEPIGNESWNSVNENDWSSASLQTYLNGSYYNSLTSEAKNLIGDTYWNLGGTSSFTSVSNGLSSHFYGYERGTTVYSGRPTYWIGKIGLMYPSDYGYATSGGTTINRASCLAKEMYNWNSSSYSDCKSNDYLYDSSSIQWTLSPRSTFKYSVFCLDGSGRVSSNSASLITLASPALYLKSNVLITGGAGTSTNPYKLEIKTGADYITSLLSSNPDTMNNDDPDGNIRYMGKDPNNYVKFNNELWRIIGVFNTDSTSSGSGKRIKIIRNNFLDYYSQWDYSRNSWSISSLNGNLNSDYLNSITEQSRSLIDPVKWWVGGSTTSSLPVRNFYYNEKGSYYDGMVGLITPSDYGFATSGGSSSDRETCLSANLYDWDQSIYSDCPNNNYLKQSNDYWTITRFEGDDYNVFLISGSGNIYNWGDVYRSRQVLPAVYLKPSVLITGGTGTQTDPYILG